MAKSIFEKAKRGSSGAWLESINPIARLSITEAKSIYDAARRYGSPRLQKIYDEIELTDPVLMTCVERRQSALAGLGWKVTVRAKADETLANEQQDAVQKFFEGVDNMTAALEHLDLAFFRGFSHMQPIWEGEGEGAKVSHINLMDSWNFLTGDAGEWLWNPNAESSPELCEPVTPEARLVSLVRRRAIDYPALTIYIRKALGENDWGRFIERYGIPPVDVIMAPNTTEAQKADYLETAEAARDGNVAVWTSGTSTSRAEGARGQDPFTAFIEHQEKLIVLSATGGTLTSLAQADTGALAGGAQMDVWEQIVSRDALVIADAIERGMMRHLLELTFPGQPSAVNFELGRERKQTPTEAAELAGKIKAAGYTVDQAELEEATGFTLVKDETPTAMPDMAFSPTTINPTNNLTAPTEDLAATALNGAQVTSMVELLKQASSGQIPKDSILPILNAAFPNVSEETILEIVGPLDSFSAQQAIARAMAKTKKRTASAPSVGADTDILAAFAADTTPIAEAIQELLKDPSKERAEALLKDLPSLLPDDPAMAAVIAEAMAEEFAEKPKSTP